METNELLVAVNEVALTVDAPPYGDDMTSSFQVGGQWFTFRFRKLREVQSWCVRDGMDKTLNANILEWAYLAQCEFQKYKVPNGGTFIYVL